jgi:hypothetical protein
MRTSDSFEILWKRCLRDALVELNPQVFQEKLRIAKEAIDMRLVELQSHKNCDPFETAQLVDGLNTLYALGFLKDRELTSKVALPVEGGSA